MQLAEVGKLLAIVKSFDNRKLDESTAFAWKLMLDREVPNATLEQATEVVLDWFGKENLYFEVRHLVAGLKRELRLDRKQIADDVRSAKARGLIDKSWSERDPLPVDVVHQLAAARLAAREAAPDVSKIEGRPAPFQLEVGRRM